MNKNNFYFESNIDKLSSRIAEDILKISNYEIRLKKTFHIVLAGGTTFNKVYENLGNSNSSWNNWFVYMGDERFVDISNTLRNDYLIKKKWLANSPIPKDNCHFIPYDSNPRKAVNMYEDTLKKVEKFDLVLLGMGEDGHTASLFPNIEGHNQQKKSVVYINNAPKEPTERITMTYRSLNNSKNVFKVISGNKKKEVFEKLLNGHQFPISNVIGDTQSLYTSISVK